MKHTMAQWHHPVAPVANVVVNQRHGCVVVVCVLHGGVVVVQNRVTTLKNNILLNI